jgi:hypothetical protein
MSSSTQEKSQVQRQPPFCSRDTEKTYVEGLEDGYQDGYRDGLQDGWSHGLTQATKRHGDNSKKDEQQYCR